MAQILEDLGAVRPWNSSIRADRDDALAVDQYRRVLERWRAGPIDEQPCGDP
jgi:hypothetical protein